MKINMPADNMYKAAIVSIGKDRPGIVGGFLEVLYALGCSIEDSSMTILYNQFTMILIVDIPIQTHITDIMTSLQEVKHKFDLFIDINYLEEEEITPEISINTGNPYVISVSGKDKTGIAYYFTTILADYGINITDFNSKLLTKSKEPVYIMMIEVSIPTDVCLEDLNNILQVKARELEVDCTMHAIEEFRL